MARAKTDGVERTFRGRRSTAGVFGATHSRGDWGATWRIASNFAPSFDAVALVDHVSDVVLAEHWHAIGEGRRADGFEKQPELASWGKAGQDAAAGRRPSARGFTGSTAKPFRDNLERTAIKISGRTLNRSRAKQGNQFQRFRVNETVEATRAKTAIRPDRIHESFMALEYDKRGNQFLFVSGLVAEAVDKAVAAFTGVALEGAVAKGNKRDLKAVRAKARGGKVYGV